MRRTRAPQGKTQVVPQGRLAISQPRDPLEREADRVADQVMQSFAFGDANPVSSIAPSASATAQVFRKATSAPPLRASSPNQTSGQAMSPEVRAPLERAFATDLSPVRIHTDANAQSAASELKARAFTIGPNIAFAQGEFQPESNEGRRLLAHELTHVIQQGQVAQPGSLASGETAPNVSRAPKRAIQRLGEEYLDDPVVPEGYTFVPDPDHAIVPDDTGVDTELVTDIRGLQPTFDYHFHNDEPGLFFVPGTLDRRAIAIGLFNDETLFRDFDFVGVPGGMDTERALRVRYPQTLLPEIHIALISAMDSAVITDANWVVSAVTPYWISDSAEWAMVERIIRWSQFSYLRDASGTNYFDVFLRRLQDVELRETHLITSDTVRTTLNWVLHEVGWKYEQVVKAIALRSEAFTSNYRVTDRGPELQVGDVIGRFYWGSGSGTQLRVMGTLVNESTLERAEIATRSHSHPMMKVVVPGTDGNYYGYIVATPLLDPLVPDPLSDQGGHFYWYYPGTIFIRPGTYETEFDDSEEPNAYRRTLLSQLMTVARSDPQTARPQPGTLLGLDYGMLAQATMTERAEIFDLVLASPGDRGYELLTRVLISTPDSEFPAFERVLSSRGSLQRILNGGSSSKILLGRVFTQKTLAAVPVGVDALMNMPTITLGKTSAWRHGADVRLRTVSSETIAEEDWDPTWGPRVGREPALPGESGGTVQRQVMEFRPISQERGWFPETRNGEWGSASLPTQLIRVQQPGPEGELRIVTAFEAGCIASVSDWAAVFETLSTVTIAYAAAFSGASLLRSFGPTVGTGIAAGGWRGGLAAAAEHAGTQGGRTALRRFAGEAILLSSLVAVDHYREDLQKTEEGRAFLALYNVALTMLVARDLSRLVNSGMVAELALRGRAALASLPRAAANRLRQTVQNFEALQLASRLRRQAQTAAVTAGGPATSATVGDAGFLTYYRQAQAQVAAEHLTTALGRSGAATTTADRVMGTLQRLRADSTELAHAQRDIARKATELLESSAAEANTFLVDIEATLAAAGPRRMYIGGFLQASTRLRAPATYLAEIRTLLARPGLNQEAITVLSGKAGRGSLDLAWLNRTTLTDADLQFLAVDSNTPWRLFQRAAEHGVTNGQINWGLRILSRGRVRGDAAEMLGPAALEAQVPGASITARQVRLENAAGLATEADFTFTLGRIRHAMEVKGWSVRVWERAIAAALARNAGTMTTTQATTVQKFDHLLRQLTVIRDTTRAAPYLAMTDGVSVANRVHLETLLRRAGLADVEIVTLSESQILATGRRLRGAMGVH